MFEGIRFRTNFFSFIEQFWDVLISWGDKFELFGTCLQSIKFSSSGKNRKKKILHFYRNRKLLLFWLETNFETCDLNPRFFDILYPLKNRRIHLFKI